MKLVIKVSLMVLALVGVIYLMRMLQSPHLEDKSQDPNSLLSLFTGDQKPLNWCPPSTAKVEVLDPTGSVSKTLTSAQDLSAVCELMVGGFTQQDSAMNFKTLLVAYPNSGNPVSLERAQEVPIFRVRGMPFASPMLEKVLIRLK